MPTKSESQQRIGKDMKQAATAEVSRMHRLTEYVIFISKSKLNAGF